LIRKSMKSSTKGSTAPFTTWETNMIMMSGALGIRIHKALRIMMVVKSQKNWGALRPLSRLSRNRHLE
jgi:hypothetical protein